MARPKGPETKALFARIPLELWGLLHKRAGELTSERGKYVSANAVLVEILGEALKPKEEKGG